MKTKKTVLVLILLFTTFFYAQQFTGPSDTTSSIYRVGNIGLGGSPQEKLHITSGKLMIGDYFVNDDVNMNWGIKSEGGIIVKPKLSWINGANIQILRDKSLIQMAIASCSGCYSNTAIEGDLVLRAHSYSTSTGRSLIITNEGTGSIKFATRELPYPNGISQVQMTIDKYGKIGIGTETIPTDFKLAVAGKIIAEELKVQLQTAWPDYVFASDYNLPALSEVEKYIKQNGHLLNVPTAKEIEKEGLVLGEITKIQQEKIEELILYTIDQQKQLDKQTKEIEELKALVNNLVQKNK